MRVYIDSINNHLGGKKMKKIIVLIMALILTLCGCEKDSYKYVNQLDSIEPSFYNIEELISDYAVEDNSNSDYLAFVKKQISQFKEFDDYDSLNWKEFDKTISVYTINPNEISNLLEGVSLDNYDASYSKKLHGIILYPIFATYTQAQQFHVVVHELCHALLDSKVDQRQNAFIVEGETELLALSFSMSLGIDPEATYPNGVFTAMWLNDLFGGKQVRDAIIENELEKMIDEVLEVGTCAKINLGGNLAEHDAKPKLGRNAEIELLCHLSKTLGKADIAEKWLEKITDTFDDVDVRYFKKILSS